MIWKKLMEKKLTNNVCSQLRLTGLYALRPFGARVPQNRSRASPFMRFRSTTFFCARKNASHFFFSGTKKRRIQPERYAKCQKIIIKY
jgi:hypothetical protein